MLPPAPGGGRSWAPTAYDPRTNIAYVPIIEACMDLVPVGKGERGSLTTGVRWTVRPRPESDGQYGRLEAIDLATGETAWISRQRAPQTTAALATGGGLVFAGSLDRRNGAYDAATGDRLWETRLTEVPNAPPITYAVTVPSPSCRRPAGPVRDDHVLGIQLPQNSMLSTCNTVLMTRIRAPHEAYRYDVLLMVILCA